MELRVIGVFLVCGGKSGGFTESAVWVEMLMYGSGGGWPISVLSMGAVFAMFSGFIHWFPLFTGVTFHRRWVSAQFFAMLVGVNVTFFPQHFLGLGGMPRRVPDYPDAYAFWNGVSSFGAMLAFFSLLFFLFLIWEALASQRPIFSVGHVSGSLEWKSMLPPKAHHMREMPRLVGGL